MATVAGLSRELDGPGPVVVGRGPTADIQVASPLVSAVHLRLTCASGHWIALDAGSRNGTYLDGNRISVLPIVPPMTLQLGDPVNGIALVLTVPRISTDRDRPLLEEGVDKAEPIVTRTIRIGRGSDNDISLTDLTVSRRHAIVRDDGSLLSVEDLDSHNGTFVNGQRIKQSQLREGDLLTVGSHRFLVVAGILRAWTGPAAERLAAESLTVITHEGRVILDQVTLKVTRGEFVAIGIDTKHYYLGNNPEEALQTARAAEPNGVFHLIRVGFPGAFRISHAVRRTDSSAAWQTTISRAGRQRMGHLDRG